MSNIPSANQKIQIEATQYRAPVSESLAQTMGGSINYALDTVAANAANIATIGAKTYVDASLLDTQATIRIVSGTQNSFTTSFDRTKDQHILVQLKVDDWNGGGYTGDTSYSLSLINSDFLPGYFVDYKTGVISAALGTANGFPLGAISIFLPRNTNSVNWQLRLTLSKASAPLVTPGIAYKVTTTSLTQDTLLP